MNAANKASSGLTASAIMASTNDWASVGSEKSILNSFMP